MQLLHTAFIKILIGKPELLVIIQYIAVFLPNSLHQEETFYVPLFTPVSPPVYLSVPQVICDVSLAQISDVDKAVSAAKEAFEEGQWGKMNPRDRGRLIYKSVSLQLR